MGLFTYVVFEEGILPEEYKKFSDWQTKDAVECEMYSLVIKKDKTMWLEFYDLLLNEKYDEKLRLGDINWEPPFKQGEKRTRQIPFHGIMNFYTSSEDRKVWIDGFAKFTDGLLSELTFEEENYK